jgi:hypothetical protein
VNTDNIGTARKKILILFNFFPVFVANSEDAKTVGDYIKDHSNQVRFVTYSQHTSNKKNKVYLAGSRIGCASMQRSIYLPPL